MTEKSIAVALRQHPIRGPSPGLALGELKAGRELVLWGGSSGRLPVVESVGTQCLVRLTLWPPGRLVVPW